MRKSVSVLLGALLSACGAAAPPPQFPVLFTAESDPTVQVAGVEVLIGTESLGRTNAQGQLSVVLTGNDGAIVPITASCPAGFRPAQVPASLQLRHTVSAAGQASPIRVSIQCLPTLRRGVVIVRAPGRGGIPIEINGTPITQTDAAGFAHIAVNLEPNQAFRVQLTTASVAPTLRPQDPHLEYTFPDQDSVFVFDQPFEEDAPPAPVRPRHPPRRGPTTRVQNTSAPPSIIRIPDGILH